MTSDRDLLLRALDDTLTDDEAQHLQDRLDADPALRREYDQLQTLDRLVRDTAEPGFEPGFADRVMARIDAEETPAADERPRRAAIYTLPSAVRWAAVAAALVIAVGLGWLVLQDDAEPTLLAEAGDAVTTYRADDGSTITLRPHATLYREVATDTRVRYRLTGEGYFDITHDPERTVEVAADDALVTVLGTRFTVRTWGAGTTVYLDEGSIRLTSQTTDAVTRLAPGQRATVGDDGTITPPTATAGATATDWLRGEMTFEQEPLRDVLAEVAYHYGLTLDAPPAALDATLSGTVVLGERDQMLTDLGLVAGGQFVRVSDQHYRFVSE
jgi:transmembrane sensor